MNLTANPSASALWILYYDYVPPHLFWFWSPSCCPEPHPPCPVLGFGPRTCVLGKHSTNPAMTLAPLLALYQTTLLSPGCISIWCIVASILCFESPCLRRGSLLSSKGEAPALGGRRAICSKRWSGAFPVQVLDLQLGGCRTIPYSNAGISHRPGSQHGCDYPVRQQRWEKLARIQIVGVTWRRLRRRRLPNVPVKATRGCWGWDGQLWLSWEVG